MHFQRGSIMFFECRVLGQMAYFIIPARFYNTCWVSGVSQIAEVAFPGRLYDTDLLLSEQVSDQRSWAD